MKITVQFESLEEFQKFVVAADQLEDEKKARAAEKKQLTKEELNESAKKTAEIINAAEAKEKAEKEEKKAKAEKPKAEEPEPEKKEEPKVDYDAMRVECRKVLSALNKATGKNTAQELIKGRGKSKLSEIEDRVLPALLEEAKEALEDAE